MEYTGYTGYEVNGKDELLVALSTESLFTE